MSTAVYGRWHSSPASRYVNACWAVEIPAELLPDFKVALGELARRFRQDSIALLAGETEFVAGVTPGGAA